MRFRSDMLAAAAGLAGSRCVGPVAPRVAAPFAPGGPARLEPGLPGQFVHPGQKGGEATGPNPTDRGRPGTKRHLVTDRQGIPLAFLLTGAHVHDSKPFDALLDAVPSVRGKRGRPRRRPAKLHADKAYDARRCRKACKRRGIKARNCSSLSQNTSAMPDLHRLDIVNHTTARCSKRFMGLEPNP